MGEFLEFNQLFNGFIDIVSFFIFLQQFRNELASENLTAFMPILRFELIFVLRRVPVFDLLEARGRRTLINII